MNSDLLQTAIIKFIMKGLNCHENDLITNAHKNRLHYLYAKYNFDNFGGEI